MMRLLITTSNPMLRAISLSMVCAMFVCCPVFAGAPLVKSFDEQVNKFAVNPKNAELYATTPTSVLIIDTLSLTKVAEIDVAGAPQGLAVSPDGTRLYVATTTMPQLAVIDLEARTLLAPIALPYVPFDVAAGNGNRLYVSPGNTSGYEDLAQVDAITGVYSTFYTANAIFLYYNAFLQISPDRNTLYIGNQGVSSGTLHKVNVSTTTPSLMTKSSGLGSNGQDLCIDGTGDYIYYAMGGGNEVLDGYDVARIRTSDLAPYGAVLTGPYPREVEIHPDNKTLYTVNEAGSIGVWNMENQTSKGTIVTQDKDKVDVEATELKVDPSGRYLFAAFDDVLRVYRVSSKAIAPLGKELSSRDSSAVAAVDMDADTVEDVISGAPLADVTTIVNSKSVILKDAGKINIRSGADGTLLRQLSGTKAGQHFGTAFVVVSDQNADSVPDIIVGEPLADVPAVVNSKNVTLKDAGRVAIYSGSNGALLSIVVEGSHAGDKLGASVALGDVDNDAQDDLVVGAPGTDLVTTVLTKTVTLKDTGSVFAFNGISNTLLYSRNGTQAGEWFGAAVAVDSLHQLYVGSPAFDQTVTINTKLVKLANAGQVQIFAGVNGVDPSIHTLAGAIKADMLGAAIAAAGSDINADTEQDWLVGVPLADPSSVVNSKTVVRKDAGRVLLYSGLNSTPVTQIDGKTAGDNFGAAIFAMIDVDSDAISDVFVGDPGHDAMPLVDGVYVKLKDAGKTELLSGASILP